MTSENYTTTSDEEIKSKGRLFMDEEKIVYFVTKFGAYDDDELNDLVARRDSLADEAIEALDRVLASRGLAKSETIRAEHQQLAAQRDRETLLSVEAKTKASRELWRGKLATGCVVMVMLTFTAPVQNFVKAHPIGAVWVLLLLLIVGYLGIKVGKLITKSICADSEISIAAKRKRLWILLIAMFPVYIIVFVITGAMFGR